MREASGPGCCASFILAIPGYLLLRSVGVHEQPAFWASFLIILVGGSVLVPYLYWRRRGQVAHPSPVPASAPSAAGWQPDPTSRHDLRFWDGTGWTDNVSTRGTSSRDPL